MTPAMKKFIELEKQKEKIKSFFEELKDSLNKVVEENGVNFYFQDEEGTVYKTVVPDGKWVQYEQYSYVRTRRSDEKRGDLSLKEAEEAGFKVERK
jgi:predicted component of type VI protein secretion system